MEKEEEEVPFAPGQVLAIWPENGERFWLAICLSEVPADHDPEKNDIDVFYLFYQGRRHRGRMLFLEEGDGKICRNNVIVAGVRLTIDRSTHEWHYLLPCDEERRLRSLVGDDGPSSNEASIPVVNDAPQKRPRRNPGEYAVREIIDEKTEHGDYYYLVDWEDCWDKEIEVLKNIQLPKSKKRNGKFKKFDTSIFTGKKGGDVIEGIATIRKRVKEIVKIKRKTGSLSFLCKWHPTWEIRERCGTLHILRWMLKRNPQIGFEPAAAIAEPTETLNSDDHKVAIKPEPTSEDDVDEEEEEEKKKKKQKVSRPIPITKPCATRNVSMNPPLVTKETSPSRAIQPSILPYLVQKSPVKITQEKKTSKVVSKKRKSPEKETLTSIQEEFLQKAMQDADTNAARLRQIYGEPVEQTASEEDEEKKKERNAQLSLPWTKLVEIALRGLMGCAATTAIRDYLSEHFPHRVAGKEGQLMKIIRDACIANDQIERRESQVVGNKKVNVYRLKSSNQSRPIPRYSSQEADRPASTSEGEDDLVNDLKALWARDDLTAQRIMLLEEIQKENQMIVETPDDLLIPNFLQDCSRPGLLLEPPINSISYPDIYTDFHIHTLQAEEYVPAKTVEIVYGKTALSLTMQELGLPATVRAVKQMIMSKFGIDANREIDYVLMLRDGEDYSQLFDGNELDHDSIGDQLRLQHLRAPSTAAATSSEAGFWWDT